MSNDLGKQIRERLSSPFIEDVQTVGRAVGAGVGLAESAIRGVSGKAADYFLGPKKKKPKVKTPHPVTKPDPTGTPTDSLPTDNLSPKTSSVPRPGTPLYTNRPDRLNEFGATAIQTEQIQPGTDKSGGFSTGSFRFKPEEEEKYVPLPLEEAAEKGRLFGYTGEQYNEMQASAFTRRKREEREGARDIATEQEKGRQARVGLMPEQPKYETGTYEEGFERPFVVGPGGKTTFPTPESTTGDGLGKLKIYSTKKEFSGLPEAEQGPYLDRLQKENPKEFLALSKILRMDL